MTERVATRGDTRPDRWNPEQYERFRQEREQPFWDLLALVRQQHMRAVVDLGCGTGTLTAALHDSLQPEATLGIDSSRAMLDRAASVHREGLAFEFADITDWRPAAPVDLVFSNAALQWVDDHPPLLRRLAGMLTEHGQLAVHVPANFDHPSHVIAATLAGEEPYRSALGGYRRVAPVLQPEAYAQMLHDLGFAQQIVRLQVYPHELESAHDVVEWTRGSLLTDYESRMPESVFAQFVEAYWTRVVEALGDARPYLYCFKRLLFWGMLGSR